MSKGETYIDLNASINAESQRKTLSNPLYRLKTFQTRFFPTKRADILLIKIFINISKLRNN